MSRNKRYNFKPIHITQNIPEFDKMVVCVALNKLFNERTFYSSKVKEIAKKLGDVSLDPDFVTSFELLHCVEWGEMDTKLERELRSRILDAFDLDPNVIDVESTVTEEKTGTSRPGGIIRSFLLR